MVAWLQEMLEAWAGICDTGPPACALSFPISVQMYGCRVLNLQAGQLSGLVDVQLPVVQAGCRKCWKPWQA